MICCFEKKQRRMKFEGMEERERNEQEKKRGTQEAMVGAGEK